MSSYIKFLKKGESLNTLCERFINLSQIESLISDLILENYDDLINYEYLVSDRFSSPKEQSLKWLATSPFYIKRVSTNVIDNIFEDCVENHKWNILNTLLTITNSNGIGISKGLLEKSIEKDIPSEIDLKLLFTLLNLEKQKKMDNRFIMVWEKRIKIKEKPHRAVILITIYSKFDPQKALDYFQQIQDEYQRLPEIHIRQLYLVAMRDVTFNFFDFYNTTEIEIINKVNYYVNWVELINVMWLRKLIDDVFNLKKINEIKLAILEQRENFFEELSLPSKEKLKQSEESMNRENLNKLTNMYFEQMN